MLCAQQSSLILTGISRPNNNFPTDGVSPNTARSLELYVVEDISDLSMYGFATSNSIYSGDQSNGAFQFLKVLTLQVILFMLLEVKVLLKNCMDFQLIMS